MKRIFYILFSGTILFFACDETRINNSKFIYDPAIPYPIFNEGDFWPNKFDQRGLQNAFVYSDKIYCNTIDVGGKSNYLYCLDPTNGAVVWRAQTEAFASQPVSCFNNIIIYCSYLGHISAFDNNGDVLWKKKFDRPYGGHFVDTTNSTLLIKTPYPFEVSKYDIYTGDFKSKTITERLKEKIDYHRTNINIIEKEYRFVRQKIDYVIKTKENSDGGYKIEITTATNKGYK